MLPLSATITSPEMLYSFRKSCAALMQVAKVRASLRHGMTMETSGSIESVSKINESCPLDTAWTSFEQEWGGSDAKSLCL